MTKVESERNVTTVSENPYLLQCNECGTRWSPNLQEGGRLHRRFAMCPKGCNADTYGTQGNEDLK